MSNWFSNEPEGYRSRMHKYLERLQPIRARFHARLNEVLVDGEYACSDAEFRAHHSAAAAEFHAADQELRRELFPRDRWGYLI